jgi:hypothetical protein
MVVSQRAKMIEIYHAVGRDRERTIAAYAAAELRGEVTRRSNANG